MIMRILAAFALSRAQTVALLATCILLIGPIQGAEAFVSSRSCDDPQSDEVDVFGPEVDSVAYFVGGVGASCICSRGSADALGIDGALSRLAEQVKKANDAGPSAEPGDLVKAALAFESDPSEFQLFDAFGFPTVTPGGMNIELPADGSVAQGSTICWRTSEVKAYIEAA